MGRYHLSHENNNDDDYDDDDHTHDHNSRVSTEEGEIIEDDDESDSHAMDIDRYDEDDENDASCYPSEEDDPQQQQRRPLSSYLPSFRSGNSRSRSDSYDHNHGGDRWGSNEGEHGRDDDDNLHHDDGNEETLPQEYRLIASSNYDRGYDRDDFYPRSSDSYASVTNAISEDEHDHRCDSRPLVVRSDPPASQLSNNKPEIHYHIYVSDEQASRWFPRENAIADDEPPRRLLSSSVVLKWMSLACLTHLLLYIGIRYDLVVVSPPPSYLTWEEYGNRQFRLIRRISREGYSLWHHLLTTTIRKETTKEFPTVGMFEFPSKWPNNSNDDIVRLYGQEPSLEQLRKGLNAWSSKKQQLEARQRQRQQRERQGQQPLPKRRVHNNNDSIGPLVVYASGGKGVGKRSLAKWMLQHLLPSKSSPPRTTNALETCRSIPSEAEDVDGAYCPLLHLTPSDYCELERVNADDYFHRHEKEDASLSSPSRFLYHKILDHVVAAGGGASIVVLDRVDCESSCSGSSCESESRPLWFRELVTEIRSQSTVFGNTVLLVTSHVGTSTAEKWRRKRLQSMKSEEAPALAEVESLVRYDIVGYHSGVEHDESSNIGLGMEDWLVVPMAPLDRNAMGSILERVAAAGHTSLDVGRPTQKETLNVLVLTELVANHILDALEWHQWIHKTRGDVLRVWSPEGAFPLLELYENRILPRIAENGSDCFRNASENSVATLDVERYVPDPRIVLRSCTEVVGDSPDIPHDRSIVTTMDGREWQCPEDGSEASSCRFYL